MSPGQVPSSNIDWWNCWASGDDDLIKLLTLGRYSGKPVLIIVKPCHSAWLWEIPQRRDQLHWAWHDTWPVYTCFSSAIFQWKLPLSVVLELLTMCRCILFWIWEDEIPLGFRKLCLASFSLLVSLGWDGLTSNNFGIFFLYHASYFKASQKYGLPFQIKGIYKYFF